MVRTQLSIYALLTLSLTAATPAVEVTPTHASVRAGTTKQFDAVLNGVPGPVTWSVVGGAGFGAITSGGLYTAPAANPGAITVRASVATSPSTSATSDALITWLNPTPAITSLTPPDVNVGTFTITVNGTGFLPTSTITLDGAPAATAFVSAAALTLTKTTSTVGNITVHVANPDPGAATSNSKTLVVMPPVSMELTPATASVRLGSARKFTASVHNALDKTVAWTVSSGSMAGDGTWTAPAAMPASGQATISAMTNADHAITGSSTVTLLNPVAVISSITPNPLAYGTQNITVTGKGFLPTSVLKQADTVLTATYVSGTQLTASVTLNPIPGNMVTFHVDNPDPGHSSSNIFIVPVGVASPLVSSLRAARFLEQGTWGPDPAAIVHVQQIGLDAWLTEQKSATPTLYPASNSSSDNLTAQQSEFFVNALRGPDQLRQRVAFALSQIFVASGVKTGQPRQMVPFLNLLNEDAFGSFRNILKDVTLAPTMGVFLDMANNDKGDTSKGTAPNENYAREVMQLFTIGTPVLNPDGSTKTVGGVPVPAYTQADITDMARALTGWTYPGPAITHGHNSERYTGPMIFVEANHDQGVKTFLGRTTQLGANAQTDLDTVLDTLSTHPNTALFISFRLIQHLVTSNPSSAYLQRVAAKFTSTNGDLWEVTKAILLDQEARQGDSLADPILPLGGHLREPLLYITTMLRTLNATVKNNNPVEALASDMGQKVFYAPSVFNYFSPLYRTANLIPPNAPTTIFGPEFQILSSATALVRANVVENLLVRNLDGDVSYNLGPFTALTGSPTDLANALDSAFMYGRMPASLKTDILTAIGKATSRADKVRNAIYLIATSGLYQVEH